MAKQITEPLNILPVSTYRWLKVNHLDLSGLELPRITPYRKEYIQDVIVDEDVLLHRAAEFTEAKQLPAMATAETYGVSKELVSLAEKSPNAGFYLYVPSQKQVREPIRIHYNLDQENPVVVDRNLIVAEENSSVTVVLDYTSAQDSVGFHNGVTQIEARNGAKVTVIKVQRLNEHSNHFYSQIALVGHGAKVDNIEVNLGSKYIVTNYVTNLEEGSEVDTASLYFGDGSQLLDLSYLMEHQGRRSVSQLDVRGALKDQARKIFKGTIDFKQGSCRARGCEEEQVILLGNEVQSEAVPLLLCTEEDVEGQHAASAGKVDEHKLFYLMSRGLSKEQALQTIVEASFNPVLAKIPIEEIVTAVRDELRWRLNRG